MADITATVDSSQIAAAVRELNALEATGQKISAGFAKFGLAPEAAKPRMSPEDLRALEAYEASLKKVSSATDELGKSSQRAGINVESMMERMATRLALLALIHQAISFIIDTFKEAGAAQTDFIQIQNMTAQSNEQTEKTFEALKQIAHDTGQDLEKTVVPAFVKLREDGFDPESAIEFDRVVSSALLKTGINLTDVAAKAEIGAAGFADIAKAAAGLGDVALGKWAQSWMAASAAEKSYEQDLTRNHELTQRAVQDAERLAGAHEQFASSTGLASAAFEAFQKVQSPFRGGIASFVTILKALADLPGGHQAFGQLLGEMQKRYGEGISQIAKEENLPAALVRAGVAAGISGFDEKSLLAAQKRGAEEQNIGRTRKEQDERYERTKAFEDARVNANELINQKMHDQVAVANGLNEALEKGIPIWGKVANFTKEISLNIGSAAQGAGQLITGQPAQNRVQAQQQGLAAYLGLMMAGIPTSAWNLLQKPAEGAAGSPQDTGKHVSNPIVDAINGLKEMLRGHG